MRPAGCAGWYGRVAGSRSRCADRQRLAEGGDGARLHGPGRCARGFGVRNSAQAAGLEAATTGDATPSRSEATATRRGRMARPTAIPGRRGTAPGCPFGGSSSPGRPGHAAAAHQVPMQMVDRLPAPIADVADQPVAAFGDALSTGDLGRDARRGAPAAAPSASVSSRTEGMCARGTIRMWVGARGAMSRKAITSLVLVDARRRQLTGHDAAEETGDLRHGCLRIRHRRPRYQSWGLVLIRKAMRPTARAIT